MDPRLAELYGTNQIEAESVAADELAEKLAAADDMNVDGLSDEDAETLAQEILAASQEETVTEEEQAEEPVAEENELAAEPDEDEKVANAQADYLGRVMAHAFTQELREIEKQASAEMNKEAGKVSNFLATKGADLAKKGRSYATAAGMQGRAAVDAVKKHPKKSMAAGAAGAFGAGRMSKKKKEASAETEESKLSALDTLAQQRALEILKANGIDPSVAPEAEEKTAAEEETVETDNTAQYEALAQKVDSRAWEMLTEAGYTKAQEEEAEKE